MPYYIDFLVYCPYFYGVTYRWPNKPCHMLSLDMNLDGVEHVNN